MFGGGGVGGRCPSTESSRMAVGRARGFTHLEVTISFRKRGIAAGWRGQSEACTALDYDG